MKSLLAACTLSVWIAAPVLALDVDNPPKGVFSDEWYVLMLDGHKSGHMHATMERVSKSGQDLIRSKMTMTLAVGRADTQISVSLEQSSDETIDGEPLAFEYRTKLAKIPSTKKGRIADGKVTISSYQFGLPMGADTYTLPEGALMTWGTYREQMKRGLKPGLKYELSVYEPSVAPGGLTRTTMEVFAPEEIDLFGRKLTAYRTKQTAHVKSPLVGEAGVVSVTWMTDAGTAVKLQISVPPFDVPFEVIACPKSVALAANDPAELMVGTLIRADRVIDADAAKSVTYRMISKGSAESKLAVPETPMQKIVENRDGMITLKLTRKSARQAGEKLNSASTRPAGASTAPDSGDLKEYIEPSADLNFKDPVVADLARKAAGDEKDPRKLAGRLCRFVHEYVQTKNLSVGFASASEVARSKEGDCTEHGILLAALGRAVGIPTRIVTGIVYTEEFAGKPNVFVGHLWTQFWLDGQWEDVDSAFNQTDVDPTHIALGVSAAGDTGIADLVTSGWMNLGKVGLKVLAVEE